MNTTDDRSFGKMIYKNSWMSKTSIRFFSKELSVDIIAWDPQMDGILDTQRRKFDEVKDSFTSILDKHLDMILQYCSKRFKKDDLAIDALPYVVIPTTILFHRDGTWGFLFDCTLDKEHGIALHWNNGEAMIGSQDDFL